jgi:hypothetical protein
MKDMNELLPELKKRKAAGNSCSLLKTMQLVFLDFLSDYPMNGLAIRRIRDITRP